MPFSAKTKLMGELKFSSPVFRHALRAAVAITIAIAAAKTLDIAHAVWIPISVIVVMRPSLGGTLQISWKRFIGTVLGAGIGVGMTLFHLSILPVLGIVFFLSFFIFYFKAKNYVIFTCILTSCVVLILGTLFSHTWQGGAERIFDTLMGIVIGLGASFLIWPNFARKTLRKEIGDLIAAQHHHFKQLREAYSTGQAQPVNLLEGRLKASSLLESASQKITDASVEPGLGAAQRQELVNLIETLTRSHRTLTALSSIVRNATGVFNAPSLRPRFDRLMDILELEFSHLETYARQDLLPEPQTDFDTAFNSFMVFLGEMRAQGEFEALELDRRNNASAFIWRIKRLATELQRIKQGVNALRNS